MFIKKEEAFVLWIDCLAMKFQKQFFIENRQFIEEKAIVRIILIGRKNEKWSKDK